MGFFSFFFPEFYLPIIIPSGPWSFLLSPPPNSIRWGYICICYTAIPSCPIIHCYTDTDLTWKGRERTHVVLPDWNISILQGGPQIKRSYKLKNSFKKSLKLTRVTKSLFASVSNKWWEFPAPQHKLSCKDNSQEKKLCTKTKMTDQLPRSSRNQPSSLKV